MLRALTSGLLAVLASPALCLAHFVWLDTAASESKPAQVRVYFGELPEPGELQLIDKIAQTQVWARGAEGRATEMVLHRSDAADLAALVADCDAPSAANLEAVCDYGVYERGSTGIRLYYYARHLSGDALRQATRLPRSERSRLDIMPSFTGDELSLEVRFDGQADADREVVVQLPDGSTQSLKTDDQGRVTLHGPAGRYAIRAGHVQADHPGEWEGHKYNQVWHYGTLTFETAEHAPAAQDAAQLLERARAARSLWKKFPGFSADIAVSAGAEQIEGKLDINRLGTVSLDLPASPLRDWASDQISSLVQHRMPDGEVSQGNVTFVAGESNHPLGRQIDLGDPDTQSRYRIQDDVIREVSRKAGPQRFTISVLEIERNAENKYLPRSFTMNFFDGASGTLTTSLGFWNQWQRVGQFDLPHVILETSAQAGGVVTRQIRFENCRLHAEP